MQRAKEQFQRVVVDSALKITPEDYRETAAVAGG